MSRTRLIAALLISITLIGGASWFRFVRIEAFQAQLVAVQEINQLASEGVFLEGILEAPVAPAPVSTEPLSATDLVSRQLFSDYVGLSSKGEVSSNDLHSLAERYAGSILGQNLTARKVNLNQISLIADSEESFSQYGQAVSNIRTKYKNLVEKQYREQEVGSPNSPAFEAFMIAAGKLYESSAQELLMLAVPTSLAENHINLVNNYFESAAAMASMSNAPEDPIVAYTAMAKQTQNAQKEAELVLNIQTALMANGIIFERGL